ncbi:hypothetical protein DFJ77DRAFT_478831 [Powellomyces hirtus]|nr:hypothetical protein DFJ77DRAFT_478831 [Powellomyces hirtus]
MSSAYGNGPVPAAAASTAMTPAAGHFLSPYPLPVPATPLSANSFLSPYSEASVTSPYDLSYLESATGGSTLDGTGGFGQQEDGLLDLMNILNSPLPPFSEENSGAGSQLAPPPPSSTTHASAARKPTSNPATGPRAPKPSIAKKPRPTTAKRILATTPKTAPVDPDANPSEAADATSPPTTTSSTLTTMQLPKLYPCTFPDCTKTFTRSYNLKSHSLLHTGIKPFACSACSATFLRKHDRDRHFNSLHGGASGRRFKCDLCGAGFARADALRRHVEVEERTGIAPNGHPNHLRQNAAGEEDDAFGEEDPGDAEDAGAPYQHTGLPAEC